MSKPAYSTECKDEIHKVDRAYADVSAVHSPLKPEFELQDKTRSQSQIWSFMNSKRRAILVIFGAVLVQLTLGTMFTIGNLSPYLISYLRQHHEPNVTNNHIVWIYALETGAQGLVMPLGGILERRIGARLTGLLASTLVCCGTAITYFTIQSTYPYVLLTYGAIFGSGIGIGYVSMVTVGMRWFPYNKGIVNGITIGAFGFGSFIFNLVQTAFLNPNNVSPGKEGYFTDEQVLNRVPNVFLLLAGIYAVAQLVGCLLLTNPPKDLPNNRSDGPSLSPSEALRTMEFYILWFTMLINSIALIYFSSMYKTFGQTFIQDDRFLAIVGSICAVSNAIGRVGWGFLIDRYNYKKCMMSLSVHMIVFLLTMQFTKNWGKSMYAVWAFLLFLGIAGLFTLISTCVSQTYGQKHTGTIYGMVSMTTVIGGPLTAVSTQYLSTIIGFNGMFYLLAALSFISLIITTMFKERGNAIE